MSGRQPCFPPTYDADRCDGNCKWCNNPLPRNKDGKISKLRRWHAGCREISWPFFWGGRVVYWELAQRNGEICAACKQPECRPLEVDHIVALWMVDRDDPDAWKFWLIANLQLLCERCHKAKSAREAKMRAKEKRLRGESCNGPKRKIPSRLFSKMKQRFPTAVIR